MNLTIAEFQTALTTLEKVLNELGADYAIMDERDDSGPMASFSTSTPNEVDEMTGNEYVAKFTAGSDVSIGGTTPASGKVAHLMIRKKPASVDELLEIRVAVVGNVVGTIFFRCPS